MKLCDINPYIRYVNAGRHDIKNEPVYSYDHRIFYILKGNCSITINDINYELSPYTFMIWHSGVQYAFKNAENIEIIVINFDFTQSNNNKSESIRIINPKDFNYKNIVEKDIFEDYPELNSPIIIKDRQNYEDRLKRIVKIWRSKSLFKNEKCSADMKKLLTDVFISLLFTSSNYAEIVDNALEFISINYYKDISNDDIGKFVGYHSYYVNKLVLRSTGITLKQHIINTRIDASEELLSQSTQSIAEVAKNCGFNSTSHFSTLFTARHGITPSEYRKNYSNSL